MVYQKIWNIPFLNGGLFECLDGREYKDSFSRESRRAAFVPNSLFWGDDTPRMPGRREGLCGIFASIISPWKKKTAGDRDSPEPGTAVHNFWKPASAFNEETASSARNESGSFYTPKKTPNTHNPSGLCSLPCGIPVTKQSHREFLILTGCSGLKMDSTKWLETRRMWNQEAPGFRKDYKKNILGKLQFILVNCQGILDMFNNIKNTIMLVWEGEKRR